MQFKTALRNAFRNPRRTLVTISTVAVGAGGLFMFQAFNEGIMLGNREHTVHAKYGNGQVTMAGYRDHVYEKPWQHWITNADQVAKKLAATPHVTDVFPRIEFFALLSNGHTSVGGKGVGIDGGREAKFFNELYIVDGAPLGADPDGIVLGKGLANALGLKTGDTVTVLGNTLRGSINGVDLVVRGIFQIGLREVDDGFFQLPLKRAQELLDTTSVEYFSLGLDDYDSWDGVERSVVTSSPELEARSFAVIDKIWYQHTVDWLSDQFQWIRLIILSIVLLGIFNSASSAVLERTREIGTLRANGESAWDVVKLMILEGMVVSTCGAAVGVAAVVVLAKTAFKDGVRMAPPPGYSVSLPVLLSLSPWIALEAVLLATATAIVAAYLAAQKAARMPIAAALRAV